MAEKNTNKGRPKTVEMPATTASLLTAKEFTEQLPEMLEELKEMSAAQRILWAIEHFGSGVMMLSSMQKTASVMMHLFASLGLKNEIIFVDTQYHFTQTLQLRDAFIHRYAINIVTLYPEMTPEDQEIKEEAKLYKSAEGQIICCRARKGTPLRRFLSVANWKILIGGIRAADGGKRAGLNFVEPDHRYGGWRFYPLLDWSDEQIDNYLQSNHVPVHPLYDYNYASIGCACCTTPIKPGEDRRAGRWRHLNSGNENGPKYCGVNTSDTEPEK